MKKWGLIWLCVLLSILMILMQGCDKNSDVNENYEKTDDNRYGVEIDGCRLEETVRADGEVVTYVIVKYLFTNYSGEAMPFSYLFKTEVYQNGVALGDGSSPYLNYIDNSFTKIQAGITIETERAYQLKDLETDVEVNVENVITDKVISKTFSIR